MRASNGEYGFSRADTPAAVSALRTSQHAILGGEVWLASEDGPSLMVSASGDTVIYGWSTDERRQGESWTAFVERTAKETLQAIAAVQPEADLRPDQVALVRFNLTYASELEFARLATRKTQR
jgi:hypothetical protein